VVLPLGVSLDAGPEYGLAVVVVVARGVAHQELQAQRVALAQW